MNNTQQVVVIRGKTMYAKVVGDPVLTYDKLSKHWVTDVVIDKDTVKEMKALGIGDRVKQKEEYADNRPYLTFRQPEFRKNGEPNAPIRIKDILNQDWPEGQLIGNESDVEVKFVINDYGPGKKKGVYIRGIRVLNLIPYAGREVFDEIKEDDPFFKQAQEAREAAQNRMTTVGDLINSKDDFDDDVDHIL